MKEFLDIVHGINELILYPTAENKDDFLNHFYANYKSKEEWSQLLEKEGFKHVIYDYPPGNKNPQGIYHACYMKVL